MIFIIIIIELKGSQSEYEGACISIKKVVKLAFCRMESTTL